MRFFILSILTLLTGCGSNENTRSSLSKPNILTITINDDPSSLDPRKARELATASILRMLFEGLTRNNEPALAESWEVSSDLLTYTFTLRDAMWSNGEPITANDFETSWKSVLDPSFPAPNAYQFFVIKGAKAAKEGKISLDEVKIHARDSKTLVVELESPTPYFIALTSTHFYFPIKFEEDEMITNGPFKLDSWKHHNAISVVKNHNYWDAESVKLNQIDIYVVDEGTALQMFKNGEIDWAGSPLSTLPQDSIQPLKNQGKLKVASAAGTHWFRFNTLKKPFDQPDIRSAFSRALNRKEIVEHITQGNQTPATGIVPKSAYFVDNDREKAKTLLENALIENEDVAEELPPISLTYAMNERNHKIAQAVQEQWKNTLGIEVQLENYESKVFYEKIKKGDFQIALGSWYADILDPMNFLDLFKHKDNATNNTGWENPLYTALLDLSLRQVNEEKRLEFLSKAEALLMEEMPVAPIFYGAFNYLQNDSVRDVHFSELGVLDFKKASKGPM